LQSFSPFLSIGDEMQAPESFVEKLESEFRGRLRIRWSTERGEWQVEQKIRRGLFPGTKPSKRGWDESTDAYVRYRDGYLHVLSVRTGDRMPCPRCGHELKVPFMETHVLRCAYCRMQGKEPHIPAVFIPLGDSLIYHLKRLDPENPISERLGEDIDRANAALAASNERDALNAGDAKAHEDYNKIVGIPQFGYSHIKDAPDFKKAA
jgi:hypothetical protein